MKILRTYPAVLMALAALGSLTSPSVQAAGGFDFAKYSKCARTNLQPFSGTIAEAAAATPQLSTLYSLVVSAGLGGALSGKGPLTVYAPTNDAFDLLPAPLVDLLVDNPDLLATVLTYHVSSGFQDPRKPLYPKETATLEPQGQTVFLDYENGKGPQINQSTATCQGVRASNGVVWFIDSVMLPQFLPKAK